MAGIGRNLKMGMIGGGPGAFIGEVHRKACRLDENVDLVAGAFDINPENSKEMGEKLNLDPSRIYTAWKDMVAKESVLPEGERIDFVSICTPNFLHFPMAKAFLEAGFHVYCEKPMTLNVEEARELVKIVEATGKVFALNHNYTGYPMVKLARDMVKAGDLGTIRKIVVQYPQGWLATKLEDTGLQQAEWRTDPKRSGAAGCMGDIGSHCENLAEYISGLRITEMCADLTIFVPGRALDDDGNVLLRFDNGAKGILHASQISVGEENNLAIWIYGEKGSLEWHQEYPNDLKFKPMGGPVQVYRRGNPYVADKSAAAGRATRLPAGHPEAFFEAMGNLYGNFMDTVRAKIAGVEPDPLALDFPDVKDGLRGMLFIETVVASSAADEKWVPMPKE